MAEIGGLSGDLHVALSVLITSLNAAETIGGQLQALAAQKWSQSWEVVVADGGSTDGTLAIVTAYAERLPNLRLVDASDRHGIGHGFNVAAAAARGEYLAFCEADDEVGTGWVAAVGAALHRDELVGFRGDPRKLNPPWVLSSRDDVQRLQRVWFPPYLEHASTLGLGYPPGAVRPDRGIRRGVPGNAGRRSLLSRPARGCEARARDGRRRPLPLPHAVRGHLPAGAPLRGVFRPATAEVPAVGEAAARRVDVAVAALAADSAPAGRGFGTAPAAHGSPGCSGGRSAASSAA